VIPLSGGNKSKVGIGSESTKIMQISYGEVQSLEIK
jgi:hypothetical protein